MKKKVRLQSSNENNDSPVLRTDRLRILRNKLGLTQEQLAKELSLSNKTISNYECSDRQPDNETLLKIAKFFGVSVSYLLGETDNPKLLDNTIVILTDKDLENMSKETRETVLAIIDSIKRKHGLSKSEEVVSNEKESRQKNNH